MPNIELHGFTKKDAAANVSVIREVLSNQANADDFVTTIVNSQVTNLKGEPQPSIRVYMTADDQIKVKEFLSCFGCDVEIITLSSFIPK